MDLRLKRLEFSEESTIGELSVDGQFECYTLEDKVRPVGGDAAGAYTARFLLGGMCGFERKICGEMCNEIWEQTTWYNSFAYDWDPHCESGIQ